MARGRARSLNEREKGEGYRFLYKFISKANLSPQEATGILEEQLQGKYEGIA